MLPASARAQAGERAWNPDAVDGLEMVAAGIAARAWFERVRFPLGTGRTPTWEKADEKTAPQG